MTESPVTPPGSLERILWRVVLVLLLVGTTLSIWAVLGGKLGSTQARILLSSFGVAIYVALALSCLSALKRFPENAGARAGVVLCLTGACVFVLGVWARGFEHVVWWKAIGVTFVLGVACAHASALLILTLAPRFYAFRTVTRLAIYGAAITLSAMMVLEHGSALAWRTVGVLETIALFGTAAVAVFARLSAKDT